MAANSYPPLIEVRTFGGFQVAGLESAARLPARGRALIGYVIAEGPQWVHRDLLLDLLWEATDPARKRHSLNQLLYTIRTTAPGIIASEGARLRLVPGVSADVEAFRQAVTSDDAAGVLSLYRGLFLKDLPFITSELDDWKNGHAALYETQFIKACKTAISEALEGHDLHRAAAIARQATLLQPECTELVRLRIELVARSDLSRAVLELDVARKRMLMNGGVVPPELGDDFVEELARLSSRLEDSDAERTMPLIGRGEELSALLGLWRASKNKAQLAWIYGEPGVGKSRLLEQCLKTAAVQGARTFVHKCSEAEMQLPYSGVVHLLQDGIRRSDLHGLDPRWYNGLSSIAPELFPDAEVAREISQRLIWESVAQLLTSLCIRFRLVIAVDDYQWLDDSSRQLLEYVISRLRDMPLLLLTCGRPTGTPAISGPEEVPRGVRLHVGELTLAETDALVSAFEALWLTSVPTESRDAIKAAVGGRPFFILQALQHLLRSSDNTTATRPLLIPPNVEAYLARRLSELGSAARSIAAAAAVLGRTAPVSLLHQITQLPPTVVCDGLEELCRAGFLVDGLTTRFSHDLMKEAVLSALTAAERAVWHGRVAETLESQASAVAAERARHYEQAGLLPRAAELAREAAQEAIRVHAYQEADIQYQRLVRCADPAVASAARAEHAKFLARIGRYDKVGPLAADLEGYFAEASDTEGLLICAIARFTAAYDKGHTEVDLLPQAKELLRLTALQNPEHLAAAMWQVRECLRLAADPVSLDEFLQLVVEAAGEAPLHIRSELLAHGSMIHALSTGYESAALMADEAVSAAVASAEPTAITRALFTRGSIRIWAGEPRLGMQDFETALSKEDFFAVPDIVRTIRANLAVAYLEMAKFDRAKHLATSVIDVAPPSAAPYSLGNIALIYLAESNASKAKEYASAMLQLYESVPRSWILLHGTSLLGLASFMEGDYASARDAAKFVEAAILAKADASEHSHLYSLVARVQRLDGRHEAALHLLNAGACAVAARDYLSFCRIELELAVTYRDLGDMDTALSLSLEVRRRAEARGATLLAMEAEQVINAIEAAVPTSRAPS